MITFTSAIQIQQKKKNSIEKKSCWRAYINVFQRKTSVYRKDHTVRHLAKI